MSAVTADWLATLAVKARQALRGETPWTAALTRDDVLARACGAEIRELRAEVADLRAEVASLRDLAATARAALMEVNLWPLP